MIEKLPDEFKNLVVPFDFYAYFKRDVMAVLPIIVAFYLYQVEVTVLFIKKWMTAKQQSQVQSYFMNNEDAVILFT